MAPYKDTKSLFDLASQSLGNYIGSVTVSVLKKFDEQMENENAEESGNLQKFIKETVEYYDTHIPPFFHNIVTFYSLIHIASYFEIDSLYSFDIETTGVLDIAIRAHITKFNFSKWPTYIKKYLCKSLHRMEKLKLLRFSKECNFSKESEYIFTCIQSMKNLQSLVCPYCDDAMLEILSNNCTLQNLDISSSCSASIASVSSLLKMKSLRTLQISCQFSIDACKCIILGLPNLIYISCEMLNQVLAQITENVVLPLQFVEYNCNSQKDVTSLINLCPSIIKLYVYQYYSHVIDLSVLATLRNLTSLAVHQSHGFYKGGIKLFLEAQGYQITELEFSDVDEISMKALYEISTLCPMLNTLVLENLEVSEQPALPIENKILFPKLEYLYCDIDQYWNHSALLFFLHNCISIKSVNFKNFEGITEKDFLDVFLYNRLEHLEELMFSRTDLTVRSIRELISSCKQLKRIGYLADWYNITTSEIEELHQYLRDNNLDVELLDYTYEDKEQDSMMKSSRHEFTVMSKFNDTGREFFVVEEDV